MSVTTLETERLLLRPIVPADVDRLVELDSDPDVLRFTDPLGEFPREPGEMRRHLLETVIPRMEATGDGREDRGFWALEERESGRFLGWLHLKPNDRPEAPELGYRLVPAARGHGYVTEASRALLELAFADPDVALVWAHTMRENDASRRVMGRLGMTHREDSDYRGVPTVVYALRRDDPGAAAG